MYSYDQGRLQSFMGSIPMLLASVVTTLIIIKCPKPVTSAVTVILYASTEERG